MENHARQPHERTQCIEKHLEIIAINIYMLKKSSEVLLNPSNILNISNILQSAKATKFLKVKNNNTNNIGKTRHIILPSNSLTITVEENLSQLIQNNMTSNTHKTIKTMKQE